MNDIEHFKGWLSDVITAGRALRRAGERHYDQAQVSGWRSSAEHLLLEVVGDKSPYYRRFVDEAAKDTNGFAPLVESCVSIVEAVYKDLTSGRLASFRKLVEAEVFADLIDAAHHILDSGHYGAAAALTGGVLERGLRDVAKAHGVALGSPGDLSGLNSRISQAGVYNALRLKEVQYFIDIRNKAAHGEFDNFTSDDANKMIAGVRSFLAMYTS